MMMSFLFFLFYRDIVSIEWQATLVLPHLGRRSQRFLYENRFADRASSGTRCTAPRRKKSYRFAKTGEPA